MNPVKSCADHSPDHSFAAAVWLHAGFALLKVLLIVLPVVEIFFEEAQYWLWSRVPDWSYYSKPPLVAYVNLISSHIFGVSHLGIRINAVMAGFLIGLILYKLAEDLYDDRRIAFFSSLSLIAFPYFWIISFFFTTDSLLILFWVLSLWLGWRAVTVNPGYRWLLALSVGFGILSKYTMLFFWPLFLLFVIRYHRPLFRSFILPTLISLLFILPMIIWNYQHDWITARHLFQLAGGGQPAFDGVKSFRHLGEYILGQYGLFILFFPLVFCKAIMHVFRGRKDEKHAFLFYPVIFVLLLFGLLSFLTHVEANWTFFALPAFSIVTARYLVWDKPALYRRTGYTTALMLVFFFLPLLAVPLNLPENRNPFKRLMGWRSVAGQVQAVMDREGDPGIRYHVITESYQWSSLLSFYLKDHPISYVLEYDRKMNQLDLWQSQLTPGDRDRYIILVDIQDKLKPIIADQFDEPIDSMEIDYPINRKDSLKYKLIVYDRFKGFCGNDK